MSIPGTDRETKPKEGQPHGWIQWKGTNVCMDLHCACGVHGHIDSAFAYYVKCGGCGRTYMTNPNIELVELTEKESSGVTAIPFNGDDASNDQ